MADKGMIYVDISQVMGTINQMKTVMSKPSFEKMMQRTFNDAGAKVKTFIRQNVPQDYAVTAGWAGSFVKRPQQLGSGVGVVVPIKGARGRAGEVFSATGGSYTRKEYERPHFRKDGGFDGFTKIKRKRINKKVKVKILRGKTSTLPDAMKHQGGQPPFRNGGAVFTRKYKGRSHPIVHVVALASPQMPANRSREKLEKDIVDTVEKRLVHHFGQLFGK